MKSILLPVLVLATVASAIAATPVISDVSVTRDPGCHLAKVSYRLTVTNAIVTAAVCTDESAGTFLDEARVTHLAGEVNRVIAADDTLVRSFTWDAAADFADDPSAIPSSFTVKLTAWPLDNPPEVMVLHLGTLPSPVMFYTSTNALPFGGLANDIYRKTRMAMRRVPAAGRTWTMGSGTEVTGRATDETLHAVRLTNDFYVAVYPLTSAQYCAFAGTNVCKNTQMPDYEMYPCNNLSYDILRGSKAAGIDWPTTGHAVAEGSAVATLRARTGLKGIDLPTEAEWEFACRAGCPWGRYNGEMHTAAGNVGNLGWYYNNSEYQTVVGRTNKTYLHVVGEKQPNAFGLYDTLGNAYEWCLDWYGDYDETALEAPTGPSTGATRVLRGGAYYCTWDMLSCSRRSSQDPSKREYASPGSDFQQGNGVRFVCPVDLR